VAVSVVAKTYHTVTGVPAAYWSASHWLNDVAVVATFVTIIIVVVPLANRISKQFSAVELVVLNDFNPVKCVDAYKIALVDVTEPN
jgi:uncharacterized membrane protein